MRRRKERCEFERFGWVAEWLKAPVLKTGRRASVSWVQIPPHPPYQARICVAKGTAMPQSRWQKKVFEDVFKERRYQERQWGDVDDTLNTPWMWCAYICSYATKWMQNPHRWRREDTEEFYDRMIQTSAIAAAAAESVLRQREAHGKTFYEGAAPPEQ